MSADLTGSEPHYVSTATEALIIHDMRWTHRGVGAVVYNVARLEYLRICPVDEVFLHHERIIFSPFVSTRSPHFDSAFAVRSRADI